MFTCFWPNLTVKHLILFFSCKSQVKVADAAFVTDRLIGADAVPLFTQPAVTAVGFV